MFNSPLQKIQHYDKYSRWIPHLKRKETWPETVARVKWFFHHELFKRGINISLVPWDQLEDAMLNLEAMPSMRIVQMAGPAAERCNVGAYNCAYLPMDKPQALGELLYILMQGTGCGYSVEQKYVDLWPTVTIVPHEIFYNSPTHLIEDSTEGWCEAFRLQINAAFENKPIQFDYSRLRLKGAWLKTKGGRSCLTGDVIVYRDDLKAPVGEQEIPLLEAFEKWSLNKGNFRALRIRAMNEVTGELYRHKVIDIIDNGIAKVFEIRTSKGYTIKATANHRFLNSVGNWQFVSKFKVGDEIAINGSTELKTGTCRDCAIAVSRRAKRCKKCNDLAQQQPNVLATTARQRKECVSARKSECELCAGTVRLQVHHKDRNPCNNLAVNLQTLCELCHKNLHTSENNVNHPRRQRWLDFDNIISIIYIGEERTFDIAMSAPDHNFVANGFISHNSGPGPLKQLLDTTWAIIREARGRKLRPFEIHRLACLAASIVQVGGVRRSAMISLSDPQDVEMRDCKRGQWYEQFPELAMANNSAVYESKPGRIEFHREFQQLASSGSGERGIFNRAGRIPERRKQFVKKGRYTLANNDIYLLDDGPYYATNPCAEIVLLPRQFCNLSIAIARSNDTKESLIEKVRLASIWGTMQSLLTNFNYLPPEWKQNCEVERLLGVDITGAMDCSLLNDIKPDTVQLLKILKKVAVDTNIEWAEKFNIPRSRAVTCNKPSGNSSQLFDVSSGIHPRYSQYYIRRLRLEPNSPISNYLEGKGVKFHIRPIHENVRVFEFPIQAPTNAIVRHDLTAMIQLNYWLMWKQHWCEHNPSCTIYVGKNEWDQVEEWVFEHWNEIGGLSFLPREDEDVKYELAPYEEITREQYEEMMSLFPKDIDLSGLVEVEDNTMMNKEFACSGDRCEF